MAKIEKIKFLSFVLLVSVLLSAAYIYDFNVNRLFNGLKSLSAGQPVAAAGAFIVLFTAVKFTFVPMTSASILAGWLFGRAGGIAVSVLAIAFSSSLMFFLSRYMGRRFTENLISSRFDWIDKYNDRLKERGFLTILFFRIVPVLPLGVVNFGLGLSRVSYLDYILATVFGSLPGVILLVLAGEYITDWDNPRLYFYLGIYLAMIAVTFGAAYKQRKKHGRNKN